MEGIEDAPNASSALRARAPTITIDSPAGSNPQNVIAPPPRVPTSAHVTRGDGDPDPDPLSSSTLPSPVLRQRSSSINTRPSLSLGSRPYSLSSPASGENGNLLDPQLLIIPGTRSRANSLGGPPSHSSFGGESLFTTPATSDDGGSRGGSGDALCSHGLGNDCSLIADPGEEHDFHVEDNPFAFSPGQLSKLFNPKCLAAFQALGGLQGLVLGLRTDSSSGLSMDEATLDRTVEFDEVTVRTTPAPSRTLIRSFTSSSIHHARSERYTDRKRVFGINRLPEKKAKSLFEIMWVTFNDKVLIILTVVAALSLALGLYQDFGRPGGSDGPKVRWVEGVTILVAVAIVVIVGSLNDYQKERQFLKLDKKKDDRAVKAIRSGKTVQISIYNVLPGDVLHLEPGDLVPADGVFIAGHNVKCDESSATGESDQIRKIPGDEVMAQIETEIPNNTLDPFIISGSKVLEGVGTYLVTGVGVHSSYGKLMMAMKNDSEPTPTPLQLKLNVMAERIAKAGCAVALLLFIVLFIRFLAHLKSDQDTPAQKAQSFLQIVIVAITVIVIAVPEGLPLAVTLALAFAMTKMLKDQNLVRVLSSCETMGNATTILTDKTGTLTTNKMTVVEGCLGAAYRFGVLKTLTTQDQGDGEQAASNSNKAVAFGELASSLSVEIREILLQSIAINSTAFEGEEDGQHVFIGLKTESALLSFARNSLGMGPVSVERNYANVIQMFPFDSSRKCMASTIRLSDGTYRTYVKGASEILLGKCTRIVTDVTQSINEMELTKENYRLLLSIIEEYAVKSLRTISLVYRDFTSWPPARTKAITDDPIGTIREDGLEDMVFLGVLGIQDPLRPGVKDAIIQCQRAGVVVRMVTGDNMGTAKAIAEECGIYTPGGVILEGSQFRNLSPNEMDYIIPRLQVLARSSPEDKRTLVRRLKELNETVAVTGDGTNDGPALRAADISFSMGVTGTEVAKEASSIILMDDNFSSIVKALEWGRVVNDAVRKFLQFQLTINVTAVSLTFVSAIANPNQEPILTPVQLLWVNLIMDTFAALALATDLPSPSILDRKPDLKSAPLIKLDMWKMIIGQSLYQLLVTLTLDFAGNNILGYKTAYEKSQLETLIFNIYVWMQIFNQLNNRRLDNKLNVFDGIHRNLFFISINVITISGQVIIVFLGGSALSAVRLNGLQWGISLVLGALSLPMAVLIRLIPNDIIRKFIPCTHDQNQTAIINV